MRTIEKSMIGLYQLECKLFSPPKTQNINQRKVTKQFLSELIFKRLTGVNFWPWEILLTDQYIFVVHWPSDRKWKHKEGRNQPWSHPVVYLLSSLYEHSWADGPGPPAYLHFYQHQGETRFLLRHVWSGWRPRGQRTTHSCTLRCNARNCAISGITVRFWCYEILFAF